MSDEEIKIKKTAEQLEYTVQELSSALGRRQLWVSEMSWVLGYREGIHKAFDMLGQRRDERVMVLVQEAEAVLKENMQRYDGVLTSRWEGDSGGEKPRLTEAMLIEAAACVRGRQKGRVVVVPCNCTPEKMCPIHHLEAQELEIRERGAKG